MRIVLAAQAERTHFLGMAPLGWALHNAGHEVRIATQPELVPVAAATGLTAVSVGKDHLLPFVLKRMRTLARLDPARGGRGFDLAELDPAALTWESVRDGTAENVDYWWRVLNEPMVDDLVAFCRQWRPDLVVWEPLTFSAAIAAAACGAAHARMLFSLDLSAHLRHSLHRLAAGRPAADRADALAEWLTALAAPHGVAFGEELVTGGFTVDYLPAALKPKALAAVALGTDQVPMRYLPYGGRAVLPDWLRTPPERPRVCVTLGTSATDRLGGYAVDVAELLTALADLDIEVVATLPPAEQAKITAVPANTRLTDYVPLNALMPTCAAIIDHGGSGTLLTAAHHGVPQLVLPHVMYDEALLGRGLTEHGAGLCIAPAEATGSAVRAALLRLLDEPAFTDRARHLRADMAAMPGPDALVPQLERRTARR